MQWKVSVLIYNWNCDMFRAKQNDAENKYLYIDIYQYWCLVNIFWHRNGNLFESSMTQIYLDYVFVVKRCRDAGCWLLAMPSSDCTNQFPWFPERCQVTPLPPQFYICIVSASSSYFSVYCILYSYNSSKCVDINQNCNASVCESIFHREHDTQQKLAD